MTKSEVTILVMQIREKPKTQMSAEEITCGGNALKFYAAVRLRISRRGLIQTDDEVIQKLKKKLYLNVLYCSCRRGQTY
jgi:RecA/RadA recombinase